MGATSAKLEELAQLVNEDKRAQVFMVVLSRVDDGRVFVCLSTSVAQIQQYRDLAQALQPGHDDLLIAVPRDIGEIRAAASELVALPWVWENTPRHRPPDSLVRRRRSPRPACHGKESGPHFNHRIERAVIVPNLLVRQRIGYPVLIDHKLVFIPPRR